MQVSMTKMAQNGQVVIPAEVRREAKLKASEQFIVYFNGSEILLKPIEKGSFAEDLEFLSKIKRAEDEIRKGRVTIADSKMTEKQIDELLLK